MTTRKIKPWCVLLLLLVVTFPFGILCHEVIGHGGTSVVLGGEIKQVVMLGIRIYPQLEWVGWSGEFQFGSCWSDGSFSDEQRAWISLGGSLSTWLVGPAGQYCDVAETLASWMLLSAIGARFMVDRHVYIYFA